MRTVFEFGGPNSFQGAKSSSVIQLDQSEGPGERFRLTYGLRVKNNLTYADACHELGAAILHWQCCEGLASNEGD